MMRHSSPFQIQFDVDLITDASGNLIYAIGDLT